LRLLALVRERPLREASDLDRPEEDVDRLEPFERRVFRRRACELLLVLVWAISGPPFASVRIPLSAPFTRICWDKPQSAKGFLKLADSADSVDQADAQDAWLAG